MTVGERAWILVPPSLGFGDEELHAHGGVVPANSHLVFDIMLLSVSDRPKFDFGEDLEEKEKTEAWVDQGLILLKERRLRAWLRSQRN